MNPLKILANKINRPKQKQKYDILTFSTHEAYQEALARTGHNFYLIELEGFKKWNESFRKLPSNCSIIKSFDKIPSSIDFILSQERYTQIQNAKNFANALRLPIVHLDHVEPISNPALMEMKAITADVNVCITEHNKNTWGNEKAHVIRHGIDTEVFSGWAPNKSKRVVYIVNYLKDRDFFCGYSEWLEVKNLVAKMDPEIEFILIGDNPGVSKTISNPVDLCSALNSCACYINTSKFSPVPMSLLEAMSCGMPIVSTRYQEVAKILDETNSMSSNDTRFLADSIVNICNNNETYSSLGQEARKFIINNHSMESFVRNWNDIFDRAYNNRLGSVNEVFYIQ